MLSVQVGVIVGMERKRMEEPLERKHQKSLMDSLSAAKTLKSLR